MKMKLSILPCLVLFLLVACPEIHGQVTNDDLRDKIVSVRMDKQALGTVFYYLMETYDIPIGFEQSIFDRGHSEYAFHTNLPCMAKAVVENEDRSSKLEISVQGESDADKHPITVNVTDGKLSEVLDQVVSQMTNYKWEINDGVVNIFPIRGRDEKFKELMDTNIATFELPRRNPVRSITVRIIQLKEFNRWLKTNKLHFNPARSGPDVLLEAQYGRILQGELKFNDLTFRELLNKIVKEKKGGWSLKGWSLPITGEEHIDLDI